MKRLGICIAAASALVLPASATAATTTLSNTDGIDLAAADPAFHPGDPYPSTVTGPAGTVNDVNVTISQAHANPDDLDIALASPNGTFVFLQSDACGADGAFRPLSFDDAGALFLSDGGPCASANNPYKPSNYEAPPDIYSPPAPVTPPVNNLAAFNGGPSGGTWSLFTMDDTNMAGGSISGWSITLDFTPTPPVTPVTPATPVAPVTPVTPTTTCKKKKKKKKRSAVVSACKKKKKKKK